MRYKSFHIKNYKGIKNLVLELDKDPISNITTSIFYGIKKIKFMNYINYYQQLVDFKYNILLFENDL